MATQKEMLQWAVTGSLGGALLIPEIGSDGKLKAPKAGDTLHLDLIGNGSAVKMPKQADSKSNDSYLEYVSSQNTTFRIKKNPLTKTLQADGTFKTETGTSAESVYPEITIALGNTPLVGAVRMAYSAWNTKKLALQKQPVIIALDMGMLVGDSAGNSTAWIVGKLGDVDIALKGDAHDGDTLTFTAVSAVFDSTLTLADITFTNLDGTAVTLKAPAATTALANGELVIVPVA